MPYNPYDIARLGHRFQPYVKHTGTGREIVAERVQRFEPTIRQPTTVYFELGNLDPVGYASDPPEFRVVIEEYVHDESLDLVLAGKSAVATSWNLIDYVNNALIQVNLLERDNGGLIVGELELDTCVLAEIQWRWQNGQPITGTYTIDGRLGKRWKTGSTPHASWGSFDTTSPGGIRPKDARLFLGGISGSSRIFRIQSMTLRVTYRNERTLELGSRAAVGYVQPPPETQLDVDIAVADAQPDDIVYTDASTYYDYVNAVQQAQSAIRIYDPAQAEATVELRNWIIDALIAQNTTPVLAQTRGMATKRYSFLVPTVVVSGTGGVTMNVG